MRLFFLFQTRESETSRRKAAMCLLQNLCSIPDEREIDSNIIHRTIFPANRCRVKILQTKKVRERKTTFDKEMQMISFISHFSCIVFVFLV
jgi:hypothetical protein